MATVTNSATPKVAGGSFLLETRQAQEVFTPEDFSEQHRLIAQTAEEFAQNEIIPNIEKMEHKDFTVVRQLLKKAGELGLSGVEIPEAYGGLEMDKVTAAVINSGVSPTTMSRAAVRKYKRAAAPTTTAAPTQVLASRLTKIDI